MIRYLTTIGGSFVKWLPRIRKSRVPARVETNASATANASLPLTEEIAAASPVLRVMAEQIRDVSREIENAIVETSMAFHGIAQRARHAVSVLQGAATSSSACDDAQAEDLIQQTRSNMLALLDRLQMGASFSCDVASRTSSMLTHLDRVEECLGNVNVLARQAKLVALNGRIEASRAGEQGKAFAVVAQETNEFAIHAVQTSGTIHSVVENLSRTLSATAQELQQHAQDESERLKESEADVTQSLNLLETTQQQMTHQLAEAMEINENLSRDISRAVMCLQFQDAVCQRLGHVMNTLESLASLMQAETMEVANHDRVQRRTQEWIGSISQSFTMDSERRIAGVAVGCDQSPEQETDACSVELF